MGPLPVAAQFMMDGASIQGSMNESDADSYIFEGGLAPIGTHGASNDFLLHPLAAKSYCGDGVRDSVEECDGVDLHAASCTTRGFASGVLSCSATCTFNDGACTALQSASSTGSSGNNDGNGTTGGGVRSVSSAARPVDDQNTVSRRRSAAYEGVSGTSEAASFFSSVASVSSESISSAASLAAVSPLSENYNTPGQSGGMRESTHLSAPDQTSEVGLGLFNVAEVGVLARLTTIYRIENAYSAIPAFQSIGKGLSPLLAMRPGSVSVQTLAWPVILWRKRKKRRTM